MVSPLSPCSAPQQVPVRPCPAHQGVGVKPSYQQGPRATSSICQPLGLLAQGCCNPCCTQLRSDTLLFAIYTSGIDLSCRYVAFSWLMGLFADSFGQFAGKKGLPGQDSQMQSSHGDPHVTALLQVNSVISILP